MTERATQYGRVLYELSLDHSVLESSEKIFSENPELVEALDNPSVKPAEKHNVIDRLFEKPVRSFLKVVADNGMISEILDIYEAEKEYDLDARNWITATLFYVTKPDERQIRGIKKKVCADYKKDGVRLLLKEDKSLIGGFILRVRDFETDCSIKGRIDALTDRLIRR